MTRGALVMVVLVLSSLATMARAQPEGASEEAPPTAPALPPNVVEANERIEHGEALYAAGDYDAALAEFERAYEVIGEHPARFQVLYNIARAHERRFRYDLALAYYRRFLNEGGASTPRAEAVRSTLDTLEGLLATVHVHTNVAAEVWIEDRQVGEAPGDVLLTGGRHVLELRAAGYETAQREIQIAPRTEQTVSVTLSALAEAYRGLEPGFFITSVVGAGVAGLLGLSLGIAVVARRGDIDADLADPVRRLTVGEAERSEIEALALATDVSFGVAGLGVVLAVVFALLTDWGGGEAASQAALPWLDVRPGGATGGVGLRW
ncbi:MAG: tetratricopeptide repeat protein [Sandaracinaceae bacterium]|nr:tetratricopeptide repeat protein [Sandaracinaceae bacterium]